MRVLLPHPLRSYAAGKSETYAEGETLAELLADLNDRYPGIRFRMIDEQEQIRPHIKIFVNAQQERSMTKRLTPDDEIMIVAALSGG